MLKAPRFWYKKNDTYLSNTLYPLSLLFRFGTKLRNIISRKRVSGLPVICIGNIVVGGAGKTPVAIKLGTLLRKNGYKPHFVSKGYGGIETNNTLIKDWHSAQSVGDESLLLSEVAPTWIGKDRNKSFILAKDNGADCIIMDDGFQNPTLQKDFSIIVINGEQGFGNKRVIPSGPLRESISRGISRANLIIVIGEIADDVKRKIPNTVPLIHANFKISKNNKIYRNQKVTAFAGIAYPDKFYNSLIDQGAILEKKISYPDHHIFDENDMLNLAETANITKSILVTTKKDFIRIPKSYRSLVSTLDGEIEFEDESLVIEILSNVLENKINALSL